MRVLSKRITLVTILAGGVLLAAIWHKGSAFALSDTSSDTTAPDSSQTTQTNPTDTTTSTDPTSSQPDSSVATGSTATQVDSNSVGTNSAQQTDQTPDPSQTSSDPTQANSSPAQDNNTDVNNNVNGTSQSGDASVTYNQQGGDATTGNSSGSTTIVNSVGSSDNLSGCGSQTFTDNVNGTQNGNVAINPDQTSPSSECTPTNSSSTSQSNSNAQNNTDVDNNVNLAATTGNADVSNNGVGGNATTGNASTEANLINLVESAIDDKQSFIGVINIYGTLNGNIVLPASMVNSLLANPQDGTGGGTSMAANNVEINNSVALTAISGMAMELNNGSGGNATSGNASTALNIYDLVNSQIVGGNVLLVFVNVMGNWYGLLLNAPAGSTSAMLGGGITQDSTAPESDVNATNNVEINNVVNLWSQTGNATVADNGVGGNATTGNASASADIVNIVGTQINLTGWLGILIINVFGTWNGSLVVQNPTVNGGVHHLKPTNHSTAAVLSDPVTYAFINPSQTGIIVSAAHSTTSPAISDGSIDNTKLARVSDKVSSDNLLFDLISLAIAGAASTVAIKSHKKLSKKI